MCDLSAVQLILTFGIGGITLRVAIAFVKAALRLDGILALILTFVLCLLATAIYLLFPGGPAFDWMCLVVIGANVFAGTQVAYQAVPPPEK